MNTIVIHNVDLTRFSIEALPCRCGGMGYWYAWGENPSHCICCDNCGIKASTLGAWSMYQRRSYVLAEFFPCRCGGEGHHGSAQCGNSTQRDHYIECKTCGLKAMGPNSAQQEAARAWEAIQSDKNEYYQAVGKQHVAKLYRER